MTTVSLLLPFMPTQPGDVLRWGALTALTPGSRLWQGQAVTVDPLQSFAYLAGAGHRVPVGTCVTLMPLKHPFQAAMEARSLAAVTGHEVVYGLGPGPVLFQELVGARPASQLGWVREYVTALRALLAGGTSEPAQVVTSGLPLQAMPSPPVRLGLGVLRPGMARLAGAVADAAITWLTPADYVASVIVPGILEGAAGADGAAAVGTDPIGTRVISVVPMALRRRGRNPYQTVLASNFGHLHGPHYQAMLRGAGIDADPRRPGPAAKAVLDGGAFLHGDAEELRAGIAAYAAAGVGEVVLNLSGVHALEGADAAFEEAQELVATLSEATATV